MTTIYLAGFALGAVCAAVYFWVACEKLKLMLKSERAAFDASKKSREEFAREFENISNRILNYQRENFTSQHKASVAELINPFANQILEFRKSIEATSKQNSEDKGFFKSELESLKKLNQTLSQNAEGLTNALKGNSKVRGDQGERVLDEVLAFSGLEKGWQYRMQSNIKDDAGNNLRPDCVVELPNGDKVIIDAKVSLPAYVKYMNEEDPKLREEHMREHIASIKRHIADLAKKSYQQFYPDTKFDFVIMFIPYDAAYFEALKFEPGLYENAYKSNIAIATPSSLMPILRTIKNLWNIEKQNQNASLISERAGRLYDKLAGFVDNMRKIDRGLDAARTAYDDAFGQLATGRGSALSIAEDMKEMGAKTSKSIKAEKRALLESND